MNIDIQPLIDDVKNILQNTYDENEPQIKEVILKFVADIEKIGTDLTAKLAEDGNTVFYLESLKRIPKLLETQLRSIGVIGAAIAQDTLPKVWQAMFDFTVKLIGEIKTKTKP